MTVLGDGGAHRTPLPQALHGRLSALKTRSMTAVPKAYAPCAFVPRHDQSLRHGPERPLHSRAPLKPSLPLVACRHFYALTPMRYDFLETKSAFLTTTRSLS